MSKIPIKIELAHEDAAIPKYAKPGDSGFDFSSVEDAIIGPGEKRLISTGLRFEIPEGYELQVRPRSGTSLKTSLKISNAPGTVDAGFRGIVNLIVENSDRTPGSDIVISKGDRIAQGVICPVVQGDFLVSTELSTTERGSGGFGSTGTN